MALLRTQDQELTRHIAIAAEPDNRETTDEEATSNIRAYVILLTCVCMYVEGGGLEHHVLYN